MPTRDYENTIPQFRTEFDYLTGQLRSLSVPVPELDVYSARGRLELQTAEFLENCRSQGSVCAKILRITEKKTRRKDRPFGYSQKWFADGGGRERDAKPFVKFSRRF